jgi:tetratricopeptide repeat protein 8
MYAKGVETFPGDTHLLLGSARIHDTMNELEKGTGVYKKVLTLDASNIEAIACLASHHFYSDQPELALKYYR